MRGYAFLGMIVLLSGLVTAVYVPSYLRITDSSGAKVPGNVFAPGEPVYVIALGLPGDVTCPFGIFRRRWYPIGTPVPVSNGTVHTLANGSIVPPQFVFDTTNATLARYKLQVTCPGDTRPSRYANFDVETSQ